MSIDNVTIVSYGVCDTVGYFEDGASFSSLAPKNTICPGNETNTSDNAKEFQLMLQITMFLGLLFLLFVMYRSCSRTEVDWYRMIFVYILGTIGVPVSIALGPSYGGFNRVAGFGIMVHNMAELFILGRIWRGIGPNRPTSCGVQLTVMYVWIILTLIVVLPLSPLFLVLMLQGSCCDWTLVATFYYFGQALDYKLKDKGKGKCGKHCNFGLAAAITHILSIQPLFFGFGTAYKVLDGITIICLIPTFIVYIWFAAAGSEDVAHLIAPNRTGLNMLAQDQLTQLEIISGRNPAPNKHNEMQNLAQRGGSASESGNGNESGGVVIAAASPHEQQLQGVLITDHDKKTSNPLNSMLGAGLIEMSQKDDELKTALKNALRNSLIFGVIMCILDSLLGFFFPCMIDTAFLCK